MLGASAMHGFLTPEYDIQLISMDFPRSFELCGMISADVVVVVALRAARTTKTPEHMLQDCKLDAG